MDLPLLFPYRNSNTAFGQNNLVNSDEVQGKIKILFFGVTDPYHPDALVNTSTTPTWLRTVGFGNNSMNIGYNSGAPDWSHLSNWGAATFCSMISLAWIYLWRPNTNLYSNFGIQFDSYFSDLFPREQPWNTLINSHQIQGSMNKWKHSFSPKKKITAFIGISKHDVKNSFPHTGDRWGNRSEYTF